MIHQRLVKTQLKRKSENHPIYLSKDLEELLISIRFESKRRNNTIHNVITLDGNEKADDKIKEIRRKDNKYKILFVLKTL